LTHKNRNITIVELARLIKSTSRTIERNIAQLKEKNILKRTGSRKDGYWKIND
jgi:ATP-dependent DNA helicase RecG